MLIRAFVSAVPLGFRSKQSDLRCESDFFTVN